MGQVIYILLGALLTAWACYAAGCLLFGVLKIRLARDEERVFRFLCGAALYSTAVLALGFLHLYYRGVFVALDAVLIIVAWRRRAFSSVAVPFAPLEKHTRWLLWGIGVPFTILYFFNAMAPEASPDGSTYHLGLVARYYRDHGMTPITTSLYAALSQGMEMLFLAAYSIGRHSAAAMTHFVFLLSLPLLILNFARRLQMERAGAAAALVVYCSPVVGIDGVSAYNDVATAAIVFAVFALLTVWDETRQSQVLIAAGLLAGFAYAVKYTAAVVIPFAIVFLLWRGYRRMWPMLLTASAVIAPWVLRNAIWWNNPLAPFFNRWFPNPYVHAWFEMEYTQSMTIYDLHSRWQIPWDALVRGEYLGGLLGPVFLLFPLALLSLRDRTGRWLLIGAAVFLALYPSNIGCRFLIPALAFIALAMLRPIPVFAPAVAVLAAILSWPNVLPLYTYKYAWRLDRVPWKWALRMRSEDEFLAARMQTYPLARMIETEVPAHRRIFSFSTIAEAYCNRDVLVGFQSAEGEVLRDIIYSAAFEDRKPTRQTRFEFSERKLRSIRVVQNTLDSRVRWSIAEIRLFDRGHELPRDPLWRIHASLSLGEVQLAFDSQPVTRWIADSGRKPAQYIQVDFGLPRIVDQLTTESSPDQPADGYSLEATGEDGLHAPLPAKVRVVTLEPQPGLRRSAMEELLARNINYLVVNRQDHIYTEMQTQAPYWGIELMEDRSNVRLYRILSRNEYNTAKPN